MEFREKYENWNRKELFETFDMIEDGMKAEVIDSAKA